MLICRFEWKLVMTFDPGMNDLEAASLKITDLKFEGTTKLRVVATFCRTDAREYKSACCKGLV